MGDREKTTPKPTSIRLDPKLQKELDKHADGHPSSFVSQAVLSYIQNCEEQKKEQTESKPEQSTEEISYLKMFTDQLKQQIIQLDHDVTFWKNSYNTLQVEYQNHVKDATKRIDEKFDRLMFYIEESRKSSPQALHFPSESGNIENTEQFLDEELLKLLKQRNKRIRENDRKRFFIQMFRM